MAVEQSASMRRSRTQPSRRDLVRNVHQAAIRARVAHARGGDVESAKIDYLRAMRLLERYDQSA